MDQPEIKEKEETVEAINLFPRMEGTCHLPTEIESLCMQCHENVGFFFRVLKFACDTYHFSRVQHACC